MTYLSNVMAKRLIPLLDRVLVEKVEPPVKSMGGVLLPEIATKVVHGANEASFWRATSDTLIGHRRHACMHAWHRRPSIRSI